MVLRHDSTAKLKKALMIIAFLFLALSNFLVFWVYINFDTIRMTFYQYPTPIDELFVGFANYKETFRLIFVDKLSDEHHGFFNSLNALAINLIILPIAIIVAYAFYKKVPGTNFFRVVFYIPSIISLIVLVTAYREMFGSAAPGPISIFLHWFGINSPQGKEYFNWTYFEPDSVTFWPLVYIFCIFNGLGTNVILINSAMQRIPKEISEAAKLDGFGFFRELRSIALPLVLPTIATWMLLIFGAIYSFSFQPMFISNEFYNSNTMTTAWTIFNNAQDWTNKSALSSTATLGICLSLIVTPFTLLTRLLFKRYTTEVQY